jgi:two-component system sensor histidine kinase UhpB
METRINDNPDPQAPPVVLDEIPFQGIVEQALAGVYVVYDECFRYVNETFAAMFGYRVDEMDGMHMRDLVTLDSGDDVMDKYRRRISGETLSIRYKTTCRHKDGHLVHLEIHGSRVLFRGKPALSGMAIDISEHVARQEELEHSREQLRELARCINTAREEQQAAFAREVHDVLGGMLSSIKMDVARISRRAAAPGREDIREISADLLVLTQDTIDAARQIADDSRPRVLDSLGLFAALSEMLQKFGRRAGIAVSLRVEGTEPALPAGHTIQCYRIVQEALTNVMRHAGARNVLLRIDARADGLEVEVSDDGRGMSPDKSRRVGIGLLSMTERAREIGGLLRIVPGESAGTSISLWLPLLERGAPR